MLLLLVLPFSEPPVLPLASISLRLFDLLLLLLLLVLVLPFFEPPVLLLASIFLRVFYLLLLLLLRPNSPPYSPSLSQNYLYRCHCLHL